MSIKTIKIVCVVAILLLVGSIIGLYRNTVVFNKVIHQELRGIQGATADIGSLDAEGINAKEYNEALRKYAIAIRPCINAINEISEKTLFYGKYNMPNTDYFSFDVEKTGRKQYIETAAKIAKELEAVIDLDGDYGFLTDPQDIASKITKVEALCEEWA